MSASTNEVALVTGGTKGIGLAIAKELRDCGYTVAVNSRHSTIDLDRYLYSEGLIHVQGDVTEYSSASRVVGEVVRRLGRIDKLVCNVGSGSSTDRLGENIGEWHRIFDINFWSSVNTVVAALNHLPSRTGAIVCISSICGTEYIKGAPIAYSVAKSAVDTFVKAMSQTIGSRALRINAIACGNILFEGSVWQKKFKESPASVDEMISNDVPLGIFGNLSDVSRLVRYLLSDNAQFVTGAVWCADGGQTRSFR